MDLISFYEGARKTYLVGHQEDIQAYFATHRRSFMVEVLELPEGQYSTVANHRWLQEAVEEVRAGRARIMPVTRWAEPGRVYSDEVHWLEAMGLRYEMYVDSYVPRDFG